jgi:tricorn protease-like protein
MNNFPQQKLREIILQYGRSLCDDPRRCEALLRDFCGQYRQEVSVLVSALKERVAADLLASPHSVPSAILLARLTKRLQDDLGLTQEAARWAVESWALALGVISEVNLRGETKPTEEKVIPVKTEVSIKNERDINQNELHEPVRQRVLKPNYKQKRKNPIGWAIVAMVLLGLGGTQIYAYVRLRVLVNPILVIRSLPSSRFLQKNLTGHSGDVESVAISPNGQTIVSGGGDWNGDYTIKIWDLATGELKRTLTGHSGDVESVAISPDGQAIVSGSYDETIKIWDLATGQLLRTITGYKFDYFNYFRSVAISPDGQTIVSGSGDNFIGSKSSDHDHTIIIWDLATGELRNTLTVTGDSYHSLSVAISPDGQTIVSGSYDKTIKIWDLATGKLLRTLTGHSGGVNSVAISPDGQTIVSGSGDNTIKIWNLATGKLLRTLTGHDYVYSVAISPDGQEIVSGSYDKTIKIWDLATGELLRTLIGHSGPVSSVAISPNGQTIVSGSRDDTIKIWRLER